MVSRSAPCFALAVLLAATPAFASHTHRISHHRATHERRVAVRAAHWEPGQRGIDADRTRAIQQALISRNYLSGAPSGSWDSETEAAMQKFQSDNGWQTKLMPDSRALIKLGLGPSGDDGAASGQNNAAAVQQATGADTLAEAHSIMN